MPPQSCINGSLAQYVPTTNQPWNAERVAHLYNRMGFGATFNEQESGLLKSPSALVDSLIDEAIAKINSVASAQFLPVWQDYTQQGNDYYDFTEQINLHRQELQTNWIKQMIEQNFRAKLSLFWHNHFVTKFGDYKCSSYLYKYYRLLMDSGLGNFRDFVKNIGKSGAMLMFLNGAENEKSDPNENYARELLELFTLGEGNGYTENDIVEAARALTGWRASFFLCEVPYFDATLHDDGMKTIFGQTDNYDHDSLVDLIFDVRGNEVAHYICRKLYRYFVYDIPDEGIVSQLAQIFVDNDFEFIPVFKALFKSQHFFDDNAINVRIKSPLECFVTMIRKLDMEYNNDVFLEKIFGACRDLGQHLFNPPDVSGWREHRAWITEETMTKRWNALCRYLIEFMLPGTADNMVFLLRDVVGYSNDVNQVVPRFIDYVLGKPLFYAPDYDSAIVAFKLSVPENYFDPNSTGSWTLYYADIDLQLCALVDYIIRLPEFQLC